MQTDRLAIAPAVFNKKHRNLARFIETLIHAQI